MIPKMLRLDVIRKFGKHLDGRCTSSARFGWVLGITHQHTDTPYHNAGKVIFGTPCIFTKFQLWLYPKLKAPFHSV